MLPPNATAQERALAETVARLSGVPVPIRDTWNPDTCPAELLPWLAWAFSVDEWNPAWSEAEKRDVIKQSLFVHKRKGTIGAIDRALRPLGYLIDVLEWFEESPPAAPYTFKVVIGTSTKPVEQNLYPQIERLINSAKNLRSQMTGITIKSTIEGDIYAAGAGQFGSMISVFPYQGGALEQIAPLYYGAGLQLIDIISVRPQT